jgi:hypothetical protein
VTCIDLCVVECVDGAGAHVTLFSWSSITRTRSGSLVASRKAGAGSMKCETPRRVESSRLARSAAQAVGQLVSAHEGGDETWRMRTSATGAPSRAAALRLTRSLASPGGGGTACTAGVCPRGRVLCPCTSMRALSCAKGGCFVRGRSTGAVPADGRAAGCAEPSCSQRPRARALP